MKNGNIKWLSIQRWWPVIVIAVGIASCFIRLESRVSALTFEVHDKGADLREDFEATKLRQDMLILKQAELLNDFEKKLTRMEVVVEYMENGKH